MGFLVIVKSSFSFPPEYHLTTVPVVTWPNLVGRIVVIVLDTDIARMRECMGKIRKQ